MTQPPANPPGSPDPWQPSGNPPGGQPSGWTAGAQQPGQQPPPGQPFQFGQTLPQGPKQGGSLWLGLIIGLVVLGGWVTIAIGGLGWSSGAPEWLAGLLGLGVPLGYLLTAIVLAVQPRTARVGAGLLLAIGVGILLAGGLCVALLAGFAQ